MLGREVEGGPKLREEMFLLSRLCVGGPRSTGVREMGKGCLLKLGVWMWPFWGFAGISN